MTDYKQQDEREVTMRFLNAIGRGNAVLTAGDRPDVIALIDGMRIGIEETKYHSDEQLGQSGSLLRNQEKKTAKLNLNQSYTVSSVADPIPALVARIQDKINISSKYDVSHIDQLWLLISGQVPQLGAVGATYVIPWLVDIAKLNAATHKLLTDSAFSAVHFHLMMTGTVFTWSRGTKWSQCDLRKGPSL